MIQQRPRLMHELVQDLMVKLCNRNQSHGIKDVDVVNQITKMKTLGMNISIYFIEFETLKY